MNGIGKYFRLLPAVLIVGTGLLAIKGVDLARAAQSPAADADAPDNTGLAPADTGGGRATNDFAADDDTIASAAEVDVLTSLTRRRAELDARERALNMRENLLSAGEGRIDQKIGALNTMQTRIQALLTQRDAAQEQQIATLVKTYSTMKPKDAARIFNALSDAVLIPVAKGMKPDILAPVLAAMNPDVAETLTVKLATLLKLPDPSPATDCPVVPEATPASSTDAVPLLPATTVALAPPTALSIQTAAVPAPPVVTLTPPQAPPAAPPAQIAVAPTPAPHKPAPHKPAPAILATAAIAPPVKPVTATIAPPAKPVTASAPPPIAPATPTSPPAKNR